MPNVLRSKKATQKLHDLSKPVHKPQIYDNDLPSLNSDDDGEEDEWSSNIDDDDLDNLDDAQSIPPTEANNSDDSDAEMPYETAPRKLPSEWRSSERTEVRALPIKLADGRIKDTGVKVVLNGAEDEFDSNVSDKCEERGKNAIEDVSTGARFGRPAVVDVLQTKSRKKRVEIAKEQIASICQEILADPENSVSVDGSLACPINMVFT
jgi:nucleolar complex protein 3